MEIATCPRCRSSEVRERKRYGDSVCLRCGFPEFSQVFFVGPERQKVLESFMEGKLEGRGYRRKEKSIEEKEKESKRHRIDYYQIHKEERKEYGMNYYKSHKDERNQYAKIYCKSERGKIAMRKASYQRRVALLSCQVNDLGKEQIKILLDNAFHCAICDKKFTRKRTKCIDHIIPLSKGGNNTLLNVQVTCRSCNSKKRDRDYTFFNNGQLLLFV